MPPSLSEPQLPQTPASQERDENQLRCIGLTHGLHSKMSPSFLFADGMLTKSCHVPGTQCRVQVLAAMGSLNKPLSCSGLIKPLSCSGLIFPNGKMEVIISSLPTLLGSSLQTRGGTLVECCEHTLTHFEILGKVSASISSSAKWGASHRGECAMVVDDGCSTQRLPKRDTQHISTVLKHRSGWLCEPQCCILTARP